MSDTTQIIIAVISTLGTILAGAGIHFVQARKSRSVGVKSEDVQSQPPSMTPDPLDALRSVIEGLSDEIQRLREDQVEDREQIRQTRADLKATREEISVERTLRQSAIEYIKRLHAWIAAHMPGTDPPAVPHDLAPHVHYYRKDPSP